MNNEETEMLALALLIIMIEFGSAMWFTIVLLAQFLGMDIDDSLVWILLVVAAVSELVLILTGVVRDFYRIWEKRNYNIFMSLWFWCAGIIHIVNSLLSFFYLDIAGICLLFLGSSILLFLSYIATVAPLYLDEKRKVLNREGEEVNER